MKKYTYLLKLNLKQANIDLSKIDPALIYKTEGDYTYVAYSCNAPLNTQSKPDSCDLCCVADTPLYCGNPFAENRHSELQRKSYKPEETYIDDVLKYLGIDATQQSSVAEDCSAQIIQERKNTYDNYCMKYSLKTEHVPDSFLALISKLIEIYKIGINAPLTEEKILNDCYMSLNPLSSLGFSMRKRGLDDVACIELLKDILNSLIYVYHANRVYFGIPQNNAGSCYAKCLEMIKNGLEFMITSSNVAIKAQYYQYYSLHREYFSKCLYLGDYFYTLYSFLKDFYISPQKLQRAVTLGIHLSEAQVHDLYCMLKEDHIIKDSCTQQDFEFYFIGGNNIPDSPIIWLRDNLDLVLLMKELSYNQWKLVAQIFVKNDGSSIDASTLYSTASRYQRYRIEYTRGRIDKKHTERYKEREIQFETIVAKMRQIDIFEQHKLTP